MANFLAELKRRNIYRVGAAYAVVAWVDAVGRQRDTHSRSPATGWAQHPAVARSRFSCRARPCLGAPACARRRLAGARIARQARSGAHGRAYLGDRLVSYQQLAPMRMVESQQASVAQARTASATQAGAVSIAVLPFLNLSSDPEQAFFSDGRTEEITAALSKIADLRVVARTSAFQFKGENKDLRAVGQALGATHLIEGSVRKAGTRVRITAQLIKTDDGTHIWSENYDRELTDVFAIQEDIATPLLGPPCGCRSA